jgi:hypothetical protein
MSRRLVNNSCCCEANECTTVNYCHKQCQPMQQSAQLKHAAAIAGQSGGAHSAPALLQ